MLNIEIADFHQGSENPHYFHPAVCRGVDDWVMTMQTFNGAGDTYGPVEYAVSTDEGKSWSASAMLEAFKSIDLGDGVMQGIADARGFYHPQTGSVIVFATITYYGKHKTIIENPDFDRSKYQTVPVYAVRNRDGVWSERRELSHPAFEKYFDWRTACTEIVILDNGELIIPIYLNDPDCGHGNAACTVRGSFDGETVEIVEAGPLVPFGKCESYLVEPSAVLVDGTFFLTIRSGDERAYLAASADGVNWDEPDIWRWDNGEPLLTINTQQHWMQLSGKTYLVYTRKDESNEDVFRWRAPLFIAEFDPERRCLIKATEQIALPLLRKQGIGYVMGNFHVSAIAEDCAVVSDAPLWFRVEKGATPEEDYIAEYESQVSIAKISIAE